MAKIENKKGFICFNPLAGRRSGNGLLVKRDKNYYPVSIPLRGDDRETYYGYHNIERFAGFNPLAGRRSGNAPTSQTNNGIIGFQSPCGATIGKPLLSLLSSLLSLFQLFQSPCGATIGKRLNPPIEILLRLKVSISLRGDDRETNSD